MHSPFQCRVSNLLVSFSQIDFSTHVIFNIQSKRIEEKCECTFFKNFISISVTRLKYVTFIQITVFFYFENGLNTINRDVNLIDKVRLFP